MEFSMREVGVIDADGRSSTQVIHRERWNGCACVFPGGMECQCDEQCPCRKVTITKVTTAALNLNPFGTSLGQ